MERKASGLEMALYLLLSPFIIASLFPIGFLIYTSSIYNQTFRRTASLIDRLLLILSAPAIFILIFGFTSLCGALLFYLSAFAACLALVGSSIILIGAGIDSLTM